MNKSMMMIALLSVSAAAFAASNRETPPASTSDLNRAHTQQSASSHTTNDFVLIQDASHRLSVK
jgi:hypothetical protein